MIQELAPEELLLIIALLENACPPDAPHPVAASALAKLAPGDVVLYAISVHELRLYDP